MGVVFSKRGGQADSFYMAVEGLLTEIIKDADVQKNNDDLVLGSLFNVKKSKQFGERQGGMTEFSDFEQVDEGEPGVADSLQEGHANLITHKQFIKTFAITKEMIEDGRFDEASDIAKNYMRAYKRSKLNFATQALVTEGETFMYGSRVHKKTTGDGKGLFATDHKGVKVGVADQSNVFTNELGTTIDTLNHLANVGRNFKNDSGVSAGFTFDTLIIPGNTPGLEETANRIIGTSLVVGSANNDINTQKGKWRLVVNHRWEAEPGTEPFLIMSSEANKAMRGNMFFNRTNLDMLNKVDEETFNLKYSGRARFGAGFFNWRQIIMGGAKTGTSLTI